MGHHGNGGKPTTITLQYIFLFLLKGTPRRSERLQRIRDGVRGRLNKMLKKQGGRRVADGDTEGTTRAPALIDVK